MKIFFTIISFLSITSFLFSQENSVLKNNAGEIHGNFEMDAQYYNPDSAIGAPPVPEKMLMQGFANILYTNGNFSAGVRYEMYQDPMLGFDPRYKGSGIPYRFASYKIDGMELTVGNFYEQFGSGMIFRAYEDKGLGVDNAVDGFRIKYEGMKGIYLKGFIGHQRSFWTEGTGIVRGFDGEVHLNELLASKDSTARPSKTEIILGGSIVSKYQDGTQITYQSSTLNVPQNVAAGEGRLGISRGKVNVNGEYVYKANDPSAFNNYIYKHGEALLVNLNYYQKGFGLSLGAKRIDNMSFKSDRTATANDDNINFIPALTKQQTYSLMAFYPYATQPNGEINFQGDITTKLKKGTPLGGKYGTDVAINFSQVYGLDSTQLNPASDSARNGYKVKYFGLGQMYFSDFNIEISKKLSHKFKIMLMYANQVYNKNVVQGESGYATIYSNIAMTELTYKIASEKSIRMELQHLYTKQDMGNWAMALVEYNTGEHWIFTAMDQYNYGNDNAASRIHYYTGAIAYLRNATRVSLGYGKQRSGIFCVGGVCRYVPASNGITLSVTTSF